MKKSTKRIISTVIVIVAVIILTIIMIFRTSDKARDNATSHMKSLTQEQSVMILDYVKNAEKTLAAYSSANEIEELLLDPNNQAKVAAAQKYTEKFSATVDGLEGIYASEWDTHVLVHTYEQYVGITTRKDKEPLEQLRNAMLAAGDGVYDTGIIISPASGKQIVSMYKAVYDENKNPIGLVGLGIFTDSLVHALNSLELNTSGSIFSMVNTADNKYIFCHESSKVGTETTSETILDICGELKGTASDTYDYVKKDNKISFYSYMGQKGWLLVIESPTDEVFEFSKSINFNMILFCSVCIILMIVFNVISIKQEQTLQKLEQSKKKQATIAKNLQHAALTDILTDVNNRISFISDFSRDKDGNPKVPDCPDSPYCFAMFSIHKFSYINIHHGHDVGDMVLATTADILKKHFDEARIYRTGSDEFVVAMQCPTLNTSGFQLKVNDALTELQGERQIENIKLNVIYSASVVKKGTSISPSVLIKLKDLINNNGTAVKNTATFVDMDFM